MGMERLQITTPRPPLSTPSSPRRVGVMGVTNRRGTLSARAGTSMPASFSPRNPENPLRPVTPREQTVRQSIRGVPSVLPKAEQAAFDTLANTRAVAADLASMQDTAPFKALKYRRGSLQRPTVLDVFDAGQPHCALAETLNSDATVRYHNGQVCEQVAGHVVRCHAAYDDICEPHALT